MTRSGLERQPGVKSARIDGDKAVVKFDPRRTDADSLLNYVRHFGLKGKLKLMTEFIAGRKRNHTGHRD